MLACSSPKLFAAGRVLHRRMAPWHPPCALCSLIFSSLDPETICLLKFGSLALLGSPLAFACFLPCSACFPLSTTGLHFFFRITSLCSCQGAGSHSVSFEFPESQFSSGFCFAVSFPMNPENDTGSSPQDFLTAVSLSTRCASFA